MQPRVAVIVLHWNREHDTRACLQSLLACTYQNLEILLVDNGSRNTSGEKLSREFPTVIFLRHESNLGFSGGNNSALHYALQRGARYVILLNNDTVVDPHFISPLVDLAESTPTIAAIGCKIYFHHQPDTLWYAGGIFRTETGVAKHRGMHEPDSGKYDRIEETDFVTGCMMFLRREALEEVGFLEESFFAYFEDADWCLRARRAGWKIVFNPRSKIWHKVSASTTIDSPFYLYLTMRNKIFMIRRHSSVLKTILFLPSLVYFYARHLLRMTLKWRSWKATRAVLYGMIDGIRSNAAGKGRLEQIAEGFF
jgi:GT2 family glycosyltransferase